MEKIRCSNLESSSGTRSVAVELTKDVESGDEADEAEAHHEDDGGSYLQARGVVSIEPQHVASAPASAKPAGAASRSTSEPPAPHPCRCGSRSARRYADGAWPSRR
uniref:Uncharacterized protein n=1 Tax=Nelumbo nucifera TaxID=4432 RepID=A0A822Y520_NELNU|nr:TPA_asm: hypothetical protein HUJ06_027602 [Nelumbo nucifera]